MTSDQNSPDVPQSAQGTPPAVSQQDSLFGSSNIPHGMGQSKSSRRRRRKRKSKTEGGEQGGGEQGSAVVSLQASSAPPAESRPPSFQAGSASQQGANGGAAATGKRWKKKFRDRQRTGGSENNAGGGFSQSAPATNGFAAGNGSNGASQTNGGGFRSSETHQFGNNAGGGYKRKGGGGGSNGGGGGKQQRGPRSFVGPMDHSYRAVNGNFAEAPPSTIETRSNGNFQSRGHSRPSFVSDSQPIDYSQGRPVPIAEDAPTKILFFIEDLFFLAKIQETARKLGVKVGFMKNEKEAIATLTSAEEADRPGLIVFDLNNANAKPLTLIPKLKTKLKKSTSIIGFLSHLQGDLKAKAVEAGCDTVMPRSAFSQNLPNLLRRYGIVEEEEANFNM